MLKDIRDSLASNVIIPARPLRPNDNGNDDNRNDDMEMMIMEMIKRVLLIYHG